MENVGIFYDRLEFGMAIWYNLWPFGLVCGHLVYFSYFGMFRPRRIWQPWPIGEKLNRLFVQTLGKEKKNFCREKNPL
jgi:hypothetical protein